MAIEFDKFIAEEPVVIPPVPEQTYPFQWLQRMVIEALSPSKPVTIYSEFIPYNGSGSTLPSPLTYNTIPDAFALAAQDPDFNLVMGGVFAMLEKYKYTNFYPTNIIS